MGEPSTQKTLLWEMMNEVLSIDQASTIKNYFTGGAHDHYDLWLFYEFHVAEDETMSSGVSKALTA